MVRPSLKLKVEVDAKELSGLEGLIRKNNAKVEGENKASAARLLADVDKSERERLATRQRYANSLGTLQRRSVAQEEANQKKQQSSYENLWKGLLAKQDKAESDKAALQRRSVAVQDKLESQQSTESERRATQRISLQRASAVLQEKQEAQSAASAARHAANSTRIERQAAIAQASVVLDKFDRRIAMERAGHAQNLVALRGNHAAVEAETRRHQAVVARIQMDKGNFPNTPFQQLLAGVKQGVGFQNGVAGMAMMAGGALGATIALSKLTYGMRSAIDSANRMNTIRRSLEFAAGGAKAGAVEFAFLSSEAKRLGFDLQSSAQGFAMLSAAAKGTTLEGKGARDIFSSISEASVTMGLSTEQTSGALMAIQQMISKGTVQSEELRGQLGERLPGAFQIAARAMGVTTSKLGDMLKAGEVMSDDFLPKFAAELHRTFGDSATKAANEGRAAIGRFNNELKQTGAVIGEVAVSGLGKLASAYLAVTSAITKSSDAQNQLYSGTLLSNNQFKDLTSNARTAKERALELAALADKQSAARKTAGPTNADKERIEKEIKDSTEAKKKAAELSKAQLEEQAEWERDFKAQAYKMSEAAAYAAAKAEHKAKVDRQAEEEDIRRTNAAYARQSVEAKKFARDAQIGAMAPGKNRDLEDSRARQQDELAAFNLSQESQTMGVEQAEMTRTAIVRKYTQEREAIEAEAAEKKKQRDQQTLSAVGSMFGGLAALSAQANMKDRAARLRWKTMAITEAGINMGRGIMQVIGDRALPTIAKIPAAIGIGAFGLAQINQIKDQQFARGTDYAPGGMALVGEEGPEMVYLPRGSQVKTASETRELVNGGGRGGSAPAINASFTINLAPGMAPSDGERIAETIDDRLRRLAGDIEQIKYRRITA